MSFLGSPSVAAVPARPSLVVIHDGDFEAVVGRARSLRAHAESLVAVSATELISGMPSVLETLDELLTGVPADVPLDVFHLVGDLDTITPAGEPAGGEAEEPDLLASMIPMAGSVADEIERQFPLIDVRSWVVLRAGNRIGERERRLVEVLVESGGHEQVAGVLVVPSSSGASHRHRAEDVDAALADLLHALVSSELASRLDARSGRVWGVGVGSVTYRTHRLGAATVRARRDEIERLVVVRPQDPGESQGRNEIADLGIGPPGPGGDDDAEASLLLAGPAGESLLTLPSAALRQLDAALEEVDPGRWAGYISAEVDLISAQTGAHGRSRLQVAFDHLATNLDERRADIAATIRSALWAHLDGQRSISSALAWCEGARAELQAALERLGHDEADELEPVDLRAAYSRLLQRTRWLPYSSSLLVRGLLIVAMMLVIGYAFAPLGSLVAWLFSNRLPFLGDDAEANAQTWARITAIVVGVILWLWWEARWRQARRLRRQYIRAADQHLRRLVVEELRRGRVTMVRGLIGLIGTPTTDGSLAAMLARDADAIRELVAGADESWARDTALGGGRWSITLPVVADEAALMTSTPSVGGDGGDRSSIGDVEQSSARLVERFLSVLRDVPMDATVEQVVESLEETVAASLDTGRGDLAEHWRRRGTVEPEVTEVLEAPLWPGIESAWSSAVGDRAQMFVATDELAMWLPGVPDPPASALVGSGDPQFVSVVWTSRLTIPGRGDRTADEDGEG